MGLVYVSSHVIYDVKLLEQRPVCSLCHISVPDKNISVMLWIFWDAGEAPDHFFNIVLQVTCSFFMIFRDNNSLGVGSMANNIFDG